MTAAPGRAPGLHHRILFAIVIVQLGLTSLLWNLVAPLIGLIAPPHLGARLGREGVSRIYRWCWWTAEAVGMMRIDSSALDALRDEPGGLIVACNHPTMLDAMIVVARLRRGVCIMKSELLRNIFLGGGSRLARYIGNDVGRDMIRAAVATLREGNQLVLFPEGTRTVTPPLNPFKPGITLIAHLAQAPIQTVLIETDSPYLSKGWPLLRTPPGPVTIRVRLGERFPPDADHRATLRRLEAYFARELGR